MSEQEVKIPSAEEVEKELLRREAETLKALDGYATFFMLYIKRFKEQIKFLSKKDLIRLIVSLADSEHSNSDNVSSMTRTANSLNLKSLLRTIGNAVECPLNEEEIKQFSKKEKQLFDLMDDLFAQKYVASVMSVKEGEQPKIITEVVKNKHDEREFNKRKQVEKDAFATGNQLLLAKVLMSQHTLLEYLDNESKEKKNESIGSSEKVNEENQTPSETGSDSRD